MTRQIGWTRDGSPFHAGEIEIQERLGLSERMDMLARRMVRDHMPDQHRNFYADLPMLLVGSVDAAGRPWASILAGRPGFIASPGSQELIIDARPAPGDPLAGALAEGAALGFLGLDQATRRRNRVNGRVAGPGKGAIRIAVDQAFGNCPQYIQTREIAFIREPGEAGSGRVEHSEGLDRRARDLIARSDTFFVATATPADVPEDNSVAGADVSHRGGKAGFVRVEGETLTVPDFAGNKHFNTLGNLLLNPRAGLTFVDFETGEVLMLSGRAEIQWDGPEVAAFKGAERLWHVTVEAVTRLEDALPFRWRFDQWSPQSLTTGGWEEAADVTAGDMQREAWRPYRVAEVVDESAVIRSFRLEPADGGTLVPFEAGQYLTVRTTPEPGARPLIRTYTLSSAPEDGAYRISVKREDGREGTPAGRVSTHLHRTLREGDLLEAKAPKGLFTFDAGERRPAVLLAGGVGVTPMISMARHAVADGRRTGTTRPVTVVHAARTLDERAFAGAFRALEAETDGALRYVSVIGQPGTGGGGFDHAGRITPALLKSLLGLDDYDFYLCGPEGFMQDLYDALRGLGVRDGRIFAEAFGPAALVRRADADEPGVAVPDLKPEGEAAVVEFASSGIKGPWVKGGETLLELAEARGLTPEFGCRAGSCGSCAARVTKGEVTYRAPVSGPHAADEALICCAVPAAGSESVTLSL